MNELSNPYVKKLSFSSLSEKSEKILDKRKKKLESAFISHNVRACVCAAPPSLLLLLTTIVTPYHNH